MVASSLSPRSDRRREAALSPPGLCLGVPFILATPERIAPRFSFRLAFLLSIGRIRIQSREEADGVHQCYVSPHLHR